MDINIKQRPDGELPDGDYQLTVRAKLVDLDEGLAGYCNIRLEGSDDCPPLGEMTDEDRDAIVGLLLKTMLQALLQQEPCRSALALALASLGLATMPETRAYSFGSEENIIET